MNTPKISVMIPVYNYGRYLRQAVESVLAQTLDDFDLVIVDDASTDDTPAVLADYAGRPGISVIRHTESQGFIRSADEAIAATAGEYLLRLDADDFLAPNALALMSAALDAGPGLGLVYADYYTVDAGGHVLEQVCAPSVGAPGEMLDQPANGAMIMFRRSAYQAVGGYDLTLSCQDGYDLWLKFLGRFGVANVNEPLFNYRLHGANYGENSARILDARRQAKRRQVAARGLEMPTVVGLVPTTMPDYASEVLWWQLDGRSLLEHALSGAQAASSLADVYLLGDDAALAAEASKFGVETIPAATAALRHTLPGALHAVVRELASRGVAADAVALLPGNAPFRTPAHIDEAMDTLLLFGADSVISVLPQTAAYYRHGPGGMVPGQPASGARQEADRLYRDGGLLYLSQVGTVTADNLLGTRVSHITLTQKEAMLVHDELSLLLAAAVVS